MLCVKCGNTLTATKCCVCGFEHSVTQIHFLHQPDPMHIRLDLRPRSKGISPQETDVDTQYRLGKECFQREDLDQAVKWLITPAKLGNSSAQLLLGYLYEVSEAHRDSDKAIFWYGQAAARGEFSAADALIRLYRAAGPLKRDKLHYWEEKRRKMAMGTSSLKAQLRKKAEARQDFIIRDRVLVKYTGTDPKPLLPGGILEIGEDAFRENEHIQSVTVPMGVRKIGSCALAECPNLTQVLLPESVKEIGDFAFADSPLNSIHLPAGLISLGEDGAFSGTDIRTVTVPGGVKTIPSQAFDGCYWLREVIIREGVSKIEGDAFGACANLEVVHIPDSMESISDKSKYQGSAFRNCSSLKTVVASEKWKRSHPELLKLILQNTK